MVYLIDANVLIRFLAADHEILHSKSVMILEEVEAGRKRVKILPSVLMEVIFVMTKIYRMSLTDLVADLKEILLLRGVVNEEREVLIEALMMMLEKRIDFVDALICAKSRLQGYGKISFDRDVTAKCEGGS